jgi:GT2 family glycosyltransferase
VISQPQVYVLVLNWNGWRDTIECLESVFRLNYSSYRVIVCDNGSTDGSLDRIAAWANEEITAECANPALQYMSVPPVSKPLPFLWAEPADGALLRQRGEKLLLVQTGSNLGFAGGNNVGLRLALAAGDMEYVWLLNNDTVVDPDALTAMTDRMRQYPEAGMCGSTLLYYYDPQTVQALGGSRYDPWTARVREVGLKLKIEKIAASEQVERELGYISGASMLVSRLLLDQVGLLDEQYFLYFEEIDWATRSRGRFGLAYSAKSLVYHKDGASSGTSRRIMRRRRTFFRDRWASPLSEFYTARNRVLFTSKYHAFALPTVIAAVVASSIQRLLYGRLQSFTAVARGLFQGLLKAVAPGAGN